MKRILFVFFALAALSASAQKSVYFGFQAGPKVGNFSVSSSDGNVFEKSHLFLMYGAFGGVRIKKHWILETGLFRNAFDLCYAFRSPTVGGPISGTSVFVCEGNEIPVRLKFRILTFQEFIMIKPFAGLGYFWSQEKAGETSSTSGMISEYGSKVSYSIKSDLEKGSFVFGELGLSLDIRLVRIVYLSITGSVAQGFSKVHSGHLTYTYNSQPEQTAEVESTACQYRLMFGIKSYLPHIKKPLKAE